MNSYYLIIIVSLLILFGSACNRLIQNSKIEIIKENLEFRDIYPDAWALNIPYNAESPLQASGLFGPVLIEGSMNK
jgi:hypothetical protein